MSEFLRDTNVQFTLVMLAMICGCTTCAIAMKCSDASEHTADAAVRKACVEKTGNPECKP